MSKRLGCLTSSGLLAGLITLAVIVGVAWSQGGMLFNPGALNAQAGEKLGGVTSHAEIGGRCSACHVAPWEKGSMDERCLKCHQKIATEQKQPQSLHGVIYQRGTPSCRQCHTEHKGANAPLTLLTPTDFPHEVFGFALTAHQRKSDGNSFVCQDCHTQRITTFDPATCESCHRQVEATFLNGHVQEYGNNCLACHDGVDRFGKRFVHPSSFPLDGKHVTLACSDCHQAPRAAADFKVAAASCFACHQKDEPHQGRFGNDCAACHSTSAWKPATFDHTLSNFPLTGAHQQVKCESCHQNNVFKGTPTQCVACHAEPAIHAGAFGTDCAACHSTNAWRPAQFNGQHLFPLSHGGGASCATCHPSTFTAYTCYGCHEHDPQKIQRKHLKEGIVNFQNCVACHPTGREHEGGGGGDD